MSTLNVINRPVTALKPKTRNARTHSAKQIGQIAISIERFGFNNPILIDQADQIIAGHGRFAAAQALGFSEVPTIRLEHLTDAQMRAYVIADNRLAELAGWDKEILALELQSLLEADIDFEITDLGFDTADIDILLSDREGADASPADNVPPVDEGLPISREGELWRIGDHRLLCGTALAEESYATLLGGELAQMVFTDPPYNVPIAGHVSGLGKVQHGDFAMACGEMSEAEFTRFLSTVMRCMASASCDGSIHFICMDWRHLLELLRAGRIAYSAFKNLCVWTKDNGGMGSLYRSQHELVAVFKKGAGPHINNIELGRHGRYRTNVWSYTGMNSFQAGRDDLLAMHPTVKPVVLVADAILDCSHRGGIILDPFVGSGTTIIAAHTEGRRCYGMELDPRYVDVALRRCRQTLEVEPVCAATGETLSQREAEVSASAALTFAE